MAAAAELHRNYVGRHDRGRQVPTLALVEKLAAALGTTRFSLVRETEQAGDPVSGDKG